MARRLLLILAQLVLAACVVPQARADGDPASDVLYSRQVFYSYDKAPSASTQRQLNGVVAAAARAGYPIRVALIASPGDLGAVTALWAQPREYARFLGLELTLAYKGSLVVVMPAGLGYFHFRHSAGPAYRALQPVRVRNDGDGLAEAAMTAVGKLAAANGHPVAAPAPVKQVGDSSSGADRLMIALAGGATLLLLVLASSLLARRRRG